MNNSQRSGVIFLLGAGASCDAGLPIMKDFFDKLRKSFKDDMQITHEKERELIEKEEKLFNFVQRKLQEARSPFHNPDNFEDVISAINDLRFVFRSRLFPFVEKWSDSLAEFHGFPDRFGGIDQISSDWPRENDGTFDETTYAIAGDQLFAASEGLIYDRLYNRVTNQLQNWLRLDTTKHDVSYLAKIADFGESVNVFTLNYDLALETACEHASIPWTTGFTYELVENPFSKEPYLEGIWDPSEFDNDKYRVKIFKLHGSVSWYQSIFRYRNGDLQVNEYPPERWRDIYDQEQREQRQFQETFNLNPPSLLFAGSTKLPGYDPYVTLFARFIETISQAKVLVIIGCRWNAEHLLSRLIGHQVKKSKNPLRLIQITKSTDPNSYQMITCGAKQALEGNLLQQALRDIEAKDQLSKEVTKTLNQIFNPNETR